MADRDPTRIYIQDELDRLTIRAIRELMVQRGYRLPPTSARKPEQISSFLQQQGQPIGVTPVIAQVPRQQQRRWVIDAMMTPQLQWPTTRRRVPQPVTRHFDSILTIPDDVILTLEELRLLRPTYIVLYHLAERRNYATRWRITRRLQGDVLYESYIQAQHDATQETTKAMDLVEVADRLAEPLPVVSHRIIRDAVNVPYSNSYEDIHSTIVEGLRYLVPNQSPIYAVELLATADNKTLTQLLNVFGYRDFTGSFDDIVSVLWWEYLANYGKGPHNLNAGEVVQAINAAPANQLVMLFPLPPGYSYATDKATLTYVALRRTIVPVYDLDQSAQQRYATLGTLPYQTVILLARYLYNYFTHDDGQPSWYSPQRFVARQTNISVMEPFLLRYQPGLSGQIAPYAGMLFPPDVQESAAKDRYFVENIQHYHTVITRPGGLLPPPDIEGWTIDRILEVIGQYTDGELLEAYDVGDQPWTSRLHLLDSIAREGNGGSRWGFRHRRCRNDDRLDLVEFEPRVKNDPANPILSYGTMNNYRCYTMNELMYVFREDPELGFKFAVPDWVRGDPIDLFPITSIVQLRELLVLTNQRNPIFANLIAVIDQGLAALRQRDNRILTLRREYETMAPERQELVREYLAWVFTTGMWFRAWRGPGSIYPHAWDEGVVRGEGARNPHQCTPTQRNRNAIVQFQRRTALLESMPRDIERWVLALPRVRYDFQTRQAQFGVEPINQLIELVQTGEFCILDASDQLIQTGYYLSKEILQLTTDEAFNRFINDSSQLRNIQQPPFIPSNYRRTGHVEFLHVLQLLPE